MDESKTKHDETIYTCACADQDQFMKFTDQNKDAVKRGLFRELRIPYNSIELLVSKFQRQNIHYSIQFDHPIKGNFSSKEFIGTANV